MPYGHVRTHAAHRVHIQSCSKTHVVSAVDRVFPRTHSPMRRCGKKNSINNGTQRPRKSEKHSNAIDMFHWKKPYNTECAVCACNCKGTAIYVMRMLNHLWCGTGEIFRISKQILFSIAIRWHNEFRHTSRDVCTFREFCLCRVMRFWSVRNARTRNKNLLPSARLWEKRWSKKWRERERENLVCRFRKAKKISSTLRIRLQMEKKTSRHRKWKTLQSI